MDRLGDVLAASAAGVARFVTTHVDVQNQSSRRKVDREGLASHMRVLSENEGAR